MPRTAIVDCAALRQNLFQPVLADVAVLDGVGGDEGGEATGVKQAVDAADEIDDQITQAGRRVFPFHVLAEGMAVGATQMLGHLGTADSQECSQTRRAR